MQLLAEEIRSSKSPPNRTLLLFTIRDHVESESPISVISKQLRADVERIWSEMKMPAGLSHLKLSTMFDIEFVALPHKRYESEQFNSQVDALRLRLLGQACLFSYLPLIRSAVQVHRSVQSWIHFRAREAPSENRFSACHWTGTLRRDDLEHDQEPCGSEFAISEGDACDLPVRRAVHADQRPVRVGARGASRPR